MFYRPNFCCNCGEKIERADWSIFASRKFCDLCQTEHGTKDWGLKLISVFGVVCLMAFVSSFFRPYSLTVKTISTESSTSASAPVRLADANFNTTANQPLQSQNGTNAGVPAVSLPTAPDAKPTASTKETDAVYYCGAATKKGTPCSRRVKHAGERCWQHQGMPSILDENGAIRKK
jgi:hypothetical protein